MNRSMKGFLVSWLLAVMFWGFFAISYAAVPHLINYQGRLTDISGQPLEGTYSLTFRIYDAETAGNLLWEEVQPAVVVQKGIFNVLLGSVTNLNLVFDKAYFLEIKVGSEVMSPRQRMASCAYAMRSENVDSLPRGVIAMWSGTIATIPQGWALCDGTNGTPDLRDKFAVGGRQDSAGIVQTNVSGALLQTGGEAKHTLTIAEMPSHSHAYVDSYGGPTSGGGSEGNYSRLATGTGYSGGGAAHNNLPPYYALAFIMKL
jgi:microcystin-dependent protein